MKKIILSLFLFSSTAFCQSSFDGTWLFTAQLSPEPAVYLLAKGMFRCSACLPSMEVEADGEDYKISESAYWDTVNLQIVDAHTVIFIAKKAGKTTFTEVDAVSPDESTLTQMVKDTTESATVTIETRSRRIAKAPAGSHAISGSWRAYETHRSRNGSITQYKCTADGFRAETPLGEKFDAKFDGKDYPVVDDPAGTMVSAKLLNPSKVELATKRNGKVVAVKQMSVAPDGKSIHVVYKNEYGETISVFDLQKQP